MQSPEVFERGRLDHPSRVFHLLLGLGVCATFSTTFVGVEFSSMLGIVDSDSLGFLRSRLLFKRLVPQAELMRGGGVTGG